MRLKCCKKNLNNQTEFWIVSAPGLPANTEEEGESIDLAFAQLKKAVNCQCFKFTIPELKVTTLNQLVVLADNLAKTDKMVEALNKKVAQYIVDMHDGDIKKANSVMKINDQTTVAYIINFRWDEARHPSGQNMQNISDVINVQTIDTEKNFKAKSSQYTDFVTALENARKKLIGGNMLTRDVEAFIKPHHFITDSEYLITYLVFIPRPRLVEWKNCYESLTPTVVPRSSRILLRDKEYLVCNVTVFKKYGDEFKQKVRERKLMIRDYLPTDAHTRESPDVILSKLEAQMNKAFGPALQHMIDYFAATFKDWIHIKAMRVFSESILKYGLPPNFMTAVLAPKPKGRKLKKILDKLYGRIDPLSLRNPKVDIELAGFGYGAVAIDYTPFVCFKLDTKI